MKRIDRYVLFGFLGAWVAALVFFTGMYLVIHFFGRINNLDDAVAKMVAQGYDPVYGFCRYYLVSLPFILVEVQPFTILMAAMWAIQSMSRRNELVPVLMAGVSFRRLAVSLLLAGFLVALGFAAIREEVLPNLAQERLRMERVFKGADDASLKGLPVFLDHRGNIVVVREYDVQNKRMRGVNVRTHGKPTRGGVFVPEAIFRGNGENGPGWYPTPVPGVALQAATDRPLDTDLMPADLEIESRSLQFLSVDGLRGMMLRHPGRLDLEVQLHGHYAYPLRTLVLLLLGLPLVLSLGGRSPYVAVGLSLLLSIGFFASQSVLEELGRRGEYLNPVLGAWLPIILFGSFGAVMFETMRT